MAAVRIVSVLIALCVLGPGLPANASEMGETAIGVDLSNYDGHWRRIDDGESDEERLSAIDHALAGLSWIVRKMASGVLRKTTAPPPEMEFVWDGDRLHQGLQGEDERDSRPVLLDGRLRSGLDKRGVPFSWSWSTTDSGLRVDWEQHQATGNNLYRIDEKDGRILFVQHTIFVTAIANIEPIVYLSRFSRIDARAQANVPTGPSRPVSGTSTAD